jgi:twitching motility protein PilT
MPVERRALHFMANLCDLVFSDLFVTENNHDCWYKQTPDALKMQKLTDEYYDDLSNLREMLCIVRRNDFSVVWPPVSGIRLRVGKMQTADDKVVYVCRRFRLPPGALASLGMPTTIAEKLMQADLNEGLVILLGKTGSGKTTTAASFVQERLTRFGGVCWTVENPMELDLQGVHGQGVCYQKEIESDREIEITMRQIYRATPNIIFIGELRDGAAVREAISAGTSGHLVVATFHAGDLSMGVARLARLAGGDSANASLSDALRVAIHVSLQNAENRLLPGKQLPGISEPTSCGTGTPPRILLVEPLWMTDQTSDGLKAIIRNGDFQLLKSEIERQKRSFMMSKLP